MLEQNYIVKLLGLEDVIVTSVERECEILRIHIELPRKPHSCPCCSKSTQQIHDYREQVIKDIPFGGVTYLHLRKRRYVCPECGKRFYEYILI